METLRDARAYATSRGWDGYTPCKISNWPQFERRRFLIGHPPALFVAYVWHRPNRRRTLDDGIKAAKQ